MHKTHIFRSQTVVRSFAFACAVSLAGCATDGAVKPSAQSQIATACSDAEMGVALASFAVKTPAQAEKLDIANTAVTALCNPTAQAAYGTPGAASSAIASIGAIITKLNAVAPVQ